ncbi:MAG: P1 family peptidase [Acidimicrobiia bacterium]|nr:P1 family peptidase [Acidimicrobiia bacterium]
MATVTVEGVRVGHHTDAAARTGCTVVRWPEGTVASGEIRGGAPATREFALLDPQRRVDRVDAVVLCGGSAFGLAAADGVMNVLADEGVGFPTSAGVVPIVVAMSIFDLGVGDGGVRPTAADGEAAARAVSTTFATGAVGAGAGATMANWMGADHAEPGGIGWSSVAHADVVVEALVVVNAVGGRLVPGPAGPRAIDAVSRWVRPTDDHENTTIGVVTTNAVLSKADCHLLAQSGHDGLARALLPAHTRYDGDALVVGATGAVEADVDHLRVLTAAVVEDAIRAVGADASA